MADESFNALFPAGRTGFVELNDGRFLAIHAGLGGSISEDRARTWSEPTPLIDQAGQPIASRDRTNVSGVARLASGGIGISYHGDVHAGPFGDVAVLCFRRSDDEGRTWSDPVPINRPEHAGGPYHDALVQLSSGRLVQPVRACYSAGAAHHDPARCTVAGKPYIIEGHAQYPELDIAFVHYSDDEGRTWTRSEDSLMVWLDDGRGGTYACDEPTLAEAKDGRLVLAMRSTIGRIVEAWSEDGGRTWSKARPNALANSYSPARICRIPTTGDLHVVWNQVSPEEIERGFRRSRLSSAISTDNGRSWKHFKTLDCCALLDPGPRVRTQDPPRFVIARKKVGEFPSDYCIYRYPNVRYVGDIVYFIYDRECVGEMTRYRSVLRAMPIESLYEDRPWDLRLSNDIQHDEAPPAMQQTDHIES